MDRIILYTRVSSELQYTNEMQEKELRDEAIKQNKIVVDVIYEDKSAKERINVFDCEEYLGYRPMLKSLFQRALLNKDYDELWIWRIDRFTRSDIPLIRYFRQRANIQLFFLRSLKGEVGEDLEIALARHENREKKLRVEAQQRFLIEKEGKFMNKPPMGYDLKVTLIANKRIQEVTVNPVMSARVKDIFIRRADGETLTSIAISMNMNKDTLFKILKNKTYLGYVKYKGEWFKGIHRPIIKRELFAKANSINYNNIKPIEIIT